MSIKLKPISGELKLDRIRYENPWWLSNEIESQYKEMKSRLYFDLFYPLVEETEPRRAVVLMGPRRVGKTVMMYHTIQKLLDQKVVDKNKVCFINIENPLYFNMALEELFSLARSASGVSSPAGYYVFFDEIQYLTNWEIHLKVLVDSYPKTKFIVSGSAAAALKLKSSESGAGRFTDFLLPPLTFHEYIHLKDFNHLITQTKTTWKGAQTAWFKTTNIQELNKHFIDYINYGGYPEVIFSEKIQANVGRYIKSDIIDKVLLRDLPSLYGIQNVQELNTFFTMLVYYCGNEVSLESLSTTSGVNKLTLKKYIEYLEAAFLIKPISKIDDCAKKFKRQTNYKIYLTNPSLRSALFSPLTATDDSFPHMVETAIFAQWMHRIYFTPWYARWKDGEVDLVGLDDKKLKPMWAVEIKWTNKPFENPYDELKSLLYFCSKNKLKEAIVTTIDKDGLKLINGVEVKFVPSSIYTYIVGYNSIENKKAGIF
ncbi:ATP-binding protein [Mucilaginibacter sp. HMF5004]|uniref:ATP-binding protein n=1 Tax=Mucilaginibacter rivuli TaxID=2857527 RepID=UPI001C5E463E|nr:ATP-binding protein [Mucilaginibacter rivuli]MBW4891438.1 ATP-binding protein [Mucilaginibacter rivuli]